MKILNPSIFAIATLVFLSAALFSNAQVPATDYYYNNFESGNLGTGLTETSADASLAVSNVAPLSGSRSLSSVGNGKMGTYKISAVNSDTNLGSESYGWEWTFLYRNSHNSVDASNTFKYWLVRENAQENSSGCYLTQIGNKLSLIFNQNNNNWSFEVPINIESNKTYAIRVQRLKQHSGWVVYLDDAALTTTGAFTKRVQTGWYPSGGATYNSSLIELKSTSANRFSFDELKMYSMKLQISGANSASNGISSPLYANQQNAVIYGLQFQTRGFFDIYQFKVNLTGNLSSIINTSTLKLNKSTDGYFGNADDALLASISEAWDAAIQYYGSANNPFARFWSVGAADGSLSTGGYLFITGNVLPNPSTINNFTIDGAPLITGAGVNENYAGTPGSIPNAATPPTPSGNVYDWVGGAAGAVNDWSVANNWRYPDDNNVPSTAPGTNDLVRIGVNKPFTEKPIISANTIVGNLIIAGNHGHDASISINGTSTILNVLGSFINQTASSILGTGTLAIKGNWTSSGGKIDLTTGNVTVEFTGTTAQSITNESSGEGEAVLFGNVAFSGGGTKTLSGSGKVALATNRYLTMRENTILQTSNLLTLKSDVSGSASVAAIPPSASIQGDVTVERYVQGGSKSMWRTYRMFSSPVYDNANPSNKTYSFTQFIDDMLITGKSEGFDQLNNSSASAWTYNNGFVAIPDINTSVNVGRGAYLLYRGDRSNPLGKVSTPYVDAESIVMTYKGKLNQQSITVPLEHGSTGFSMLGNPYAATIDWNAIVKTGNVDYVVRIWNPSNRQYATFNGIDGLNGGSRYIGPGQGFFVQTTDGNSPSVTFTEDAKVTSVAQVAPLHNVVMAARSEQAFVEKLAVQNTNTVQTAIAVETPAKVRIKLTRDGYENEDETLVVLKRNEPASFAGYDVARSGGESVFLSSLSSEGSKMGINYMPHISSIQKVALDVNVSNNGDYKMQFVLTDVPLGYEIKLNDKYLNTITDVTNEGTVYSLSIDKAVGSSLGDRFELLVGPSTTLPVTLVDFAGDKVNDGVLLKWQTSSEVNNSHFEIQRAGDDRAYITIGSVVANAAGSYNLLDKSPLNGNNYYRLVQIDNNGNQTTFPKLAQVKFDLNGTSGLLVYPTLVQSTFTMKFNGNLSSKQYIVKVSDATGKEVYTKGASKEEVYNGFIGELATMPSGVYFAALLDSTNGNRLGVVKMIKK